MQATTLKCHCPDDCNCRYPWRVNYCGCKAHGIEPEDTSEEPCTDHGFDVCPDCGNVGVRIGPAGYVPCTRFLTCWADVEPFTP